jgi:NAD(P)-dependent dehydrogenase (short-subunit alcohol dehydrogenase family)
MSNSDLPLAGKSALVTGGGSGIGLASAKAMVADGMSVTIMGRTEAKLDAGAEELREVAAGGATVTTFPGDVTDESSVEEAVKVASEATGQLDSAVAAAGDGTLGPVIAMPVEEWNRVLAVTLTGVFLVFKHAGARIAANPQGGTMVAISSVASHTTHRFMAPYAVAKAGVDMLVKNTADELGEVGVRVNAVNPGIIRTDLVAMITEGDPVGQSYLDNMPISRFGEVTDVAPVVRHLCGPESSFITGATIPIDGGQHMRRGPDYYVLAKGLYGDAADGKA